MQVVEMRKSNVDHKSPQRMGFRYLVLALGVTISVCMVKPAMADTTSEASIEQESSWNTIGREICDVGDAVGDASKEAWNSTKETSAKVWVKTKETGSDVAEGTGEVADATVETSKSAWKKSKEASARWYKSAKSTLHEWTAPSSGD